MNLVLQGTPTFFDLLCVSHQERLFIRSGLETGLVLHVADTGQDFVHGSGSSVDLDLDVQGIWIEIGFGSGRSKDLDRNWIWTGCSMGCWKVDGWI